VEEPERFYRFGVKWNRFFLRESPSKGKEKEPMHEWQSLSHARWECKYHVVIIPKYRKRKLYGQLGKRVGEVIREKYAGSEESRCWKGIRGHKEVHP
jgi:putative transposase